MGNSTIKQILLPASIKRELVRTFEVGRNELSRALNYRINSSRAQMLRAAALQRGGLIYRPCGVNSTAIPNVDTEFDHNRGLIFQSFGNRMKIVINRQTNVMAIHIDGAIVATFNDLTIADWGDALQGFQQIYNQLQGI